MSMSMDRWKGKVAIVTGASSGIGAAIAEKLVEEGLQVVALARRKDRLEELRDKTSDNSGKLHPFQTDITNEKDILKAFEWTKKNLGPVHILVNNAGINIREFLAEGSTESWNKILQVNVIGLSIATREALKDMKENHVDGHIIHINSVVGHQIIKRPMVGMYTASKHSVTTLTESLRFELATSGSKTKITSISPGLVQTELLDDKLRKDFGEMELLQGRDIADAVIYVLSTPPRVQIHELTILERSIDRNNTEKFKLTSKEITFNGTDSKICLAVCPLK